MYVCMYVCLINNDLRISFTHTVTKIHCNNQHILILIGNPQY